MVKHNTIDGLPLVVVFDCETTGFSAAAGHRMIELGAVKLTGDGAIGEFHSLIDADFPISRGAQRVPGEQLRQAPLTREFGGKD